MLHVDNIVVMEYVNDMNEECPLRIINLYSAMKKYKSFILNLDLQTWGYGNYQNIKIGNMRSVNFNNEKSLQGIMGVYDNTSLAHINNEAKHIFQITQNLKV